MIIIFNTRLRINTLNNILFQLLDDLAKGKMKDKFMFSEDVPSEIQQVK